MESGEPREIQITPIKYNKLHPIIIRIEGTPIV
jgi:hypothetical protein